MSRGKLKECLGLLDELERLASGHHPAEIISACAALIAEVMADNGDPEKDQVAFDLLADQIRGMIQVRREDAAAPGAGPEAALKPRLDS